MRKPTKFKKRRKPMSPEQKAAAVERLAKARAARQAAAGPPKNVAASVLALDENHPFSLKNVRGWIKTQQELRAELRKSVRQNVKGAIARLASCEAYIRNLDKYVRDGEYVDMRYGEHQEFAIKYRCVKPAYNKDGTPKYSYGVFYDDLGYVYGMQEDG